MSVQADLQTAGQPRRHPHMAEVRFFIDEIEVVTQALAVIPLSDTCGFRPVSPCEDRSRAVNWLTGRR
jgi:hypothetical protein